MKKNKLPVLLLLSVFILSSCASPYPPTDFIGKSNFLPEGSFFKGQSVSSTANFLKYRKIIIQEPDLTFLGEDVKGRIPQADLEKLAAEFKMSLKEELNHTYEIVDDGAAPSEDSLVIAPAIVYAKTPNRLLNLATFFFFFIAVSPGSAAFEARITDGGTRKILAQISEKRSGALGLKPILIGPFTRYVHARAIFKKWSKELSRFLIQA